MPGLAIDALATTTGAAQAPAWPRAAARKAARVATRAAPYVALGALYLAAAYLFLINGASGHSAGLSSLPLDQAWSRMAYAKSFGEHLQFSFDDPSAEAGVTSHLWAALVGLTWRASGLDDPGIVAVAKLLGMAFAVGSGILTFRIAARITSNERLGFLAAALLLVQPEFIFASVSGFEVPLAAFLALAATLSFYAGRLKLTGTLMALLVATRPEAIAFVAVVAVALVARQMWQREQLSFLTGNDVRALTSLVVPTLVLGGALAALNFTVNGGPAPNSYYARHVDLGLLPAGTIVNALSGYYRELSLFAGFLFPVITLIYVAGAWSIGHRHGFRASPLVLFPLVQIYAVAVTFPVPSDDWPFLFRRYLDVTLPFVAIGIVVGWTAVWRQFRGWREKHAPSDQKELRLFTFGLSMLFVFLVAVPFVALPGRWGRLTADYSWNSKNIHDVQVATAHWIAGNIEPAAVLAVDSPGAIAFFTGNRLVDLTGVNSHEAIGREVFGLMEEQGVDFLFAFSSVHFDSWVNGLEMYRVEADRNTVLPSSMMKGWEADWDATVDPVDSSVPQVFSPSALGLRVIDSLDVGNPGAPVEQSEGRHEYQVTGAVSTVDRVFKLDA
ncbi:MAG: hypothetical protein HY678_00410 [Chloroflexi bacterium]|nr:hypothetical protein [Chloroflexota bacterium]